MSDEIRRSPVEPLTFTTQTGPPSPSPWLLRLVEILDTWDTTDDGTSYFDSSRVLIRELRRFITPDALLDNSPPPVEPAPEAAP